MNYTYQFRLKPNKQQKELLNKHFGCVRFIYNYFLNQRIEYYNLTKKSQNEHENKIQLPKLKQEFPWLKETNSQSLQYAIDQLQDAYNGFFGISKHGKPIDKKGFPKFKKKNNEQSFRIPQNIQIIENEIDIPKFKQNIKFTKHRNIEGKIKFATITKNKINQYFVNITVERNIIPLPKNTNKIGIDLNIKDNVDNNNNKQTNLKPKNKLKKKLKKLHKEHSRKQKRSKNKEKARIKLAKIHLKVHNQRMDSLHKYSKHIINNNQVICVENLSVKDMLKKLNPENRKLTRKEEKSLHDQIVDCAWGTFVRLLEYKAKMYERTLVKVSQWFPSSQICFKCKYRNHDLKPNERNWFCFGCLQSNERDHNSAQNILEEGLRILDKTSGTGELACCPGVRLVVNNDEQLVGQEASIL